MTEIIFGHTLECVLAAMDRAVEDWKGHEWEKVNTPPALPFTTRGALCGTLEDRYEAFEVDCTCRPDVTICRCCMDRWMENTHGLEDVACEYHGCDHDPDLPMSLITEEIEEVGYREPYFTNRGMCDGCGSTLGGDRFDMVYV